MVFLLPINENEYKEVIKDYKFNPIKKDILWINKIVNPKNKKKYEINKLLMKNYYEVKNVYHGSNRNSLNRILMDGFTPLKI
jgi:RNA:NAD 2'-phosphotransferase (TPT1/KptA family)